MAAAVRAVTALAVALALSACTATPTKTDPPAAQVASTAGSDVGNDRPTVSYDGLMVRRRVVIAIQASPGINITTLSRQLESVATRHHTTLSPMSVSVLDPAVLETFAPRLVVALPAGATGPDARTLIDSAAKDSPALTVEMHHYDIASVLVHDLRFTVHTPDPAALAGAVAAEGIVSDALGNYTTTLSTQQIDITYTGPLLSDALIESIRRGIARPAAIAPQQVTVAPRTATGIGVDMAKEPTPAPAATQPTTSHHHSAPPSRR